MNLARKIKEPMTVPASSAHSPSVSYPSTSLSDEVADEFLKTFKPKLGDTVTAEVTFKVVGLREDEYGKSVSLDLQSLASDAESEDESAAEKKMLGYKRPTKTAPAPMMESEE